MGYTHYWTQTRNLTPDEWAQVTEDLQTILNYVEHEQGIALSDAWGEGGKRPEFTADLIAFNGLGEESHESLVVYRKRRAKEAWEGKGNPSDFCKTARKPYDLAVTACLAYLSTVIEGAWDVSSDGRGRDWLNGVEAVRRALPKWGNVVDIPRGVMESDRWCQPYITNRSASYAMRFCVDGKAYIIRHKDGLARAFDTHREAAEWIKARHIGETLVPMGFFDEARWKKIASAQTRIFREAVGFAEREGELVRPPAYVRPDEFPDLPHRAYSIDDLLNLAS